MKLFCVSAVLLVAAGCGSSPEDKLLGVWQGTDEFGQTMQFTFSPDSQFRLDVTGANQSFSKHGSYQADLSEEPGHLDIELPDREIKTILDLIDEQHIAYENVGSSPERPVDFGDRTIIFQRQ